MKNDFYTAKCKHAYLDFVEPSFKLTNEVADSSEKWSSYVKILISLEKLPTIYQF